MTEATPLTIAQKFAARGINVAEVGKPVEPEESVEEIDETGNEVELLETEDDTEEVDDDSEEIDEVAELKSKLDVAEKALKKANRERQRLGRITKDDSGVQEADKWKTLATRKAVDTALKDAGIAPGTKLEKLVGLLDLSEIDIDEDGEFVGLDDQIDDLKESFPSLFAPVKPVRKAPTKKVDMKQTTEKVAVTDGRSAMTQKLMKSAGLLP